MRSNCGFGLIIAVLELQQNCCVADAFKLRIQWTCGFGGITDAFELQKCGCIAMRLYCGAVELRMRLNYHSAVVLGGVAVRSNGVGVVL